MAVAMLVWCSIAIIKGRLTPFQGNPEAAFEVLGYDVYMPRLLCSLTVRTTLIVITLRRVRMIWHSGSLVRCFG
jgi:hypothetical protein